MSPTCIHGLDAQLCLRCAQAGNLQDNNPAKPPTHSCKTCKFSEPRPFEDHFDAIVCMKHPPTSHPIMFVGKKGPEMIGTTSMRAPLSDLEWCYEFELDVFKRAGLLRP